VGESNLIQGQYAKAEPLRERALAICEKTLGPDQGFGLRTRIKVNMARPSPIAVASLITHSLMQPGAQAGEGAFRPV
jgi:hypothetical protein